MRVNGFGIFFMVLYPGAFVDLFTEHLAVISPLRQLRIYCAGVWHNFILVLIAVGFLLILPSVLSLGYVSNQGAVILDLSKVRGDSPITQVTWAISFGFTKTMNYSCSNPNLHGIICVTEV